MEQLLKIKDSKIQSLVSKLQQAGIAWSITSYLWYFSLNE